MNIIYRMFIFIFIFILLLTSTSVHAEKENDPLNTLDALNHAIVSIYSVEREPSKVTIDEEYNKIINNIAWGNITADPELLNLFTEMMNAYTENRLDSKDRDLLRRQYEAQVNRAFLEVKPLSHIQSEVALNTAREVANTLSLTAPGSWVGSAARAGLGFGEYQVALQANERIRRQAQGQEQEYMQQRMAGEWELDKAKIRRFNTLKTSLMNAAWPLLNRYNIPDEARITEDNLNQYYNFISEKDRAKALRIGKRLQNSFAQFPEFWFHFGVFYLENGNIKEARACFEKCESLSRPILRKNILAAANARYKIFTLNENEKEEAKRLVDIIEKQSANDDWNNILFSALQNYQLGNKKKAEDLLLRNIDDGYSVELNKEILKQVQNDKLDLNAVKEVAIREIGDPTELEKLAEAGNAEAQKILGEKLYYTYSTKKMKDGLELLNRASSQGNFLAKCLLANIQFRKGEEYKNKWNNEGKNIIEELINISDSSGEANNCLGLFYSQGISVPKDVSKAMKYYKIAADKDDYWGNHNLGMHYIKGVGTNKDINKGIECLQKSAKKGNQSSLYELGRIYILNKNFQDIKRGLELLNKAASSGFVPAQNFIASMYRDGEGVTKDLQKAAEWYQKSVNEDNALAQFFLASMYEKGHGVTKDTQKAVELYEKSAHQGNAYAQNNLAYMYYQGEGVERNIELARKLFKKAADQGNQLAKNNLDYLSSNHMNADASKDWSDGISAYSRGDKELAKRLLTRACKGGSKAACRDLQKRF